MNEIIIKQDINFLDKPLWFQNIRSNELGFIWDNIEGYECRSSYKPPDKIDMMILFYLLYKSQRLDFKNKISVSKYEILKECGLLNNAHQYYYQRLEDSLKRWKNVTIEFKGIFYDGKNYKSLLFGIINEAKIKKDAKYIEVEFNPSWLSAIKESKFFKYIYFKLYKGLKRSVAKRLCEILCKTFKSRDKWSIHLTKLGHKLTISPRIRKTADGKQEKVIYASDVLTAIKPAIHEINTVFQTFALMEESNIRSDDLVTISYTITGQKQDRVIHFQSQPLTTKSKPAKNMPQPAIAILQSAEEIPPEAIPLPSTERPKVMEATRESAAPQITPEMQLTYADAIRWLDKIPNFAEERKQDILNLPMPLIIERYPGIRQQYEKMARVNKTPTPGWVYSAFIKQYEFSADIKRKQVQEGKKLQEIRAKNAEQITAFIENNGGKTKVLYDNKKIIQIYPNDGIELEDRTLYHWQFLKMEKFTILEE